MKPIVILGVFVADLTFRNDKLPSRGETLIGKTFKLGPGGKGSNQVIAASRSGANVAFITKVGKDPFANMALDFYAKERVSLDFIFQTGEKDTGAAAIMVDDASGENAIIVVPGAADLLSPEDVNKAESAIKDCSIFMTNLEIPVETMQKGLELAKKHNVITIFNPAPAVDFPESVYTLCDYFTPNETEAESLAGVPVTNVEEAKNAAKIFRDKGVKTSLITLGEMGCYFMNDEGEGHIPAFEMKGNVVETTGAGDAFNGSLATALAEGQPLQRAIQFASATAAISVTRFGTAPAMPTKIEIEDFIKSN